MFRRFFIPFQALKQNGRRISQVSKAADLPLLSNSDDSLIKNESDDDLLL